VSYAGFRGYQHPELLLHFAHAISC
jgi:hypothetical protein